jgi:hypothetical protein
MHGAIEQYRYRRVIDRHTVATVESTLVSIPTVLFKQLFRMIDQRAKVGRFSINLDYNTIMGST